MNIIPAMQCCSLDGWYPYPVQSETDEDKSYVVHVNPWANRSEQNVCECKSYHYRGYCKHHCGWNEIEGPEQPTDEQRTSRICPRCGEPAMWAMWETPEE
jgi:anaerobic ribonucleoside-triphosphate reductase